MLHSYDRSESPTLASMLLERVKPSRDLSHGLMHITVIEAESVQQEPRNDGY
jgi:hypothetical protein